MNKCSISGCVGKFKGLGFCDKHYQRFKKRGTTEGFAPRENHGLKHTPEYEAWCGMKKRCYNKNTHQYKDWGGRGIIVCERWLHSFSAFLEDMGTKPSPEYSIDRTDNNGNYEPGNCRWSTHSEQASNKRTPTHYFKKVIRTTTGYRGVYPYKTYWVAKLWYKGKLLHLGSFEEPQKAALAYDQAALELYGDVSILNFMNGPDTSV